MAIAYGTTSVATDSSSPGSFSFSHDNEGDDVVLVGIAALGPSGDVTISSPDFGGDALILEGYSNRGQTSSPHVWLFSLGSPASGSQTVSGTFSANMVAIRVVALPASGADASDIIGALETGDGVNNATVTDDVTIDTANSDVLMLFSIRDATNAPPITPGASMTELDEGNTGGTGATSDAIGWLANRSATTVGAYTVAGTASSATERFAWIAFELHIGAAPAAGRVMSSLAASGGLAYKGGIAGAGGGLAG